MISDNRRTSPLLAVGNPRTFRMPLHPDPKDVALRLALTIIAGLVIGFDRGRHGRPAGIRTTLLVCLSASLSMILANLLVHTDGKTQTSFVQLDMMRLPLGILSGIGFIGAGAILKKGNLVVGVTTAATIWFTTVMGLCFGAGELGLGITALVLGYLTLWGLEILEERLPQDMRITLNVTVDDGGPSEESLRTLITENDCKIVTWAIVYSQQGRRREIESEILRRVLPSETKTPAFVSRLSTTPQVEKVVWRPEGGTSGANS